jgi:hypothetical protein
MICHFGSVFSVETNGWIENKMIQLRKIVFVIVAATLNQQEPTLSNLCISSSIIA